MFAFLLVIMSVVNLSMCLFACLCLSASVCLRMPVYLSVYLSIYMFVCCRSRSVGRRSFSAVGQSRCARSVQAAEGEDAESESGRLHTQERKTGLMNVELRTGAESR